MSEHYKQVWRVDCEDLSIKITEVTQDAPLGEWISWLPQPYAYLETEKEAKELLRFVIQDRINDLQTQLEATK